MARFSGSNPGKLDVTETLVTLDHYIRVPIDTGHDYGTVGKVSMMVSRLTLDHYIRVRVRVRAGS